MTLLDALLLVLGSWGLGFAALAAFGRLDPRAAVERQRRPGDATLAALCGSAVLSLAALALGLCGLLRPAPLRLLLVGGVAGLVWFGWAPASSSSRRGWPRPGLLPGLLGSFVALGAIGNLVRALAPPTAWDALAYHLAIARAYAQAGALVDLASIRQAHWPLAIDLLFAVGESLGGAALSGFIAWCLGILLLVAAAGLAAELADEGSSGAAGLLAAGLLAGAPVVAFLQGAAYVECGLAAWVAGALWSGLRGAAPSGRRSDLAVAGLLAGAAAGAKYTALVFPPLIGLVILLSARAWRPAALAFALSLGVAAPWYARTFALTGNPIWPYAFDLLGGRNWGAAHAARLAAFEQGYGPGTSPGALLRLPWRLAFEPGRFDGLMLGPAFLALLPLALAGHDRRRRALVVFLALGGIAWLCATQQIRFLVPLLPALAAAIAAGQASGRWPRSASLALGLTTVLAGLALMLAAPAVVDRARVVVGAESRADYLARNLDHSRAIDHINRVLRPRRLLLFREVRGYGLEVPYLWGDPLNQALIDYPALADPTALADRLAELGVDAVLVNDGNYPESPGYYDRRTLALMDAMLRAHGHRVYLDGQVSVWLLLRPPSSISRPAPAP